MKKIIFFCILLLSTIIAGAQTHLCYDVYYFRNPNHTLKTYKKILVITNASFKSIKNLKKAARKNNYNIVVSSELFPPIKSYTDIEIAESIKDNQIDAILYYTIKGSTEVSSYSYGTYTIPSSNGIGTFSTNKHSKYFTTIEAALVEPQSKDEKEFYCSGGAKGNSFDVTYRVFNKILKRFEKIGIAHPPQKA